MESTCLCTIFWLIDAFDGCLSFQFSDNFTKGYTKGTLCKGKTKPWRAMLESTLLYLWWRTWKYTGQRRKLVFSTTLSRQKASPSVCFVILSTIDFGLGGAEDRSRHHRKTNVFFWTLNCIFLHTFLSSFSSSLCIQNWNECCPKMRWKSNTMGQPH